MKALVKPAALRAGATLAVLSPASTPKVELVHRGMERLRALGYKTVLSPHALDGGPLHYAGTLQQRLSDLHAAFADPAVDGIVCTRGGWGSAELLPYLDADLVRANPKVFVGYSDHSSLHSWFRNEANLVTFYAPMVAADFARDDGVDLASWNHAFLGDDAWSLGSADGLRVLRAGAAEGRLLGGCLSILVQGLGTPFAPVFGEGTILFLEDIGTKPYQWDRMLLHLRYSGRLEGVKGIVFGNMTQCVADDELDYLERAILHSLRDFNGPIAIGLRCGHVYGANMTLPLGVQVKLDLTDWEKPRMDFVEAAVSV
ncbi:MAG TPA: LD-carboxypeptidase [Edaphobacter sp.]